MTGESQFGNTPEEVDKLLAGIQAEQDLAKEAMHGYHVRVRNMELGLLAAIQESGTDVSYLMRPLADVAEDQTLWDIRDKFTPPTLATEEDSDEDQAENELLEIQETQLRVLHDVATKLVEQDTDKRKVQAEVSMVPVSLMTPEWQQTIINAIDVVVEGPSLVDASGKEILELQEQVTKERQQVYKASAVLMEAHAVVVEELDSRVIVQDYARDVIDSVMNLAITMHEKSGREHLQRDVDILAEALKSAGLKMNDEGVSRAISRVLDILNTHKM